MAIIIILIMAYIYIATKAILYADGAFILVSVYYVTNKYFSIKYSSGYAIYFWNISASILALMIYIIIFLAIYVRFKKTGKFLNFIISTGAIAFMYIALARDIVHKNFVRLLNDKLSNDIANVVIIILVGYFVYLIRMSKINEILNSQQQ